MGVVNVSAMLDERPDQMLRLTAPRPDKIESPDLMWVIASRADWIKCPYRSFQSNASIQTYSPIHDQ
jgi:hypothetical protein